MMQIEDIKSLFLKYKEENLFGRYITNEHINPLLKGLSNTMVVETIGESVFKAPIYGVKIGCGAKRILMWSQMHGNESTTTKALFDLFNTLKPKNGDLSHILEACTLYIIPILNPDGAKVYTRINGNKIDLNRDAQDLTQPESIVLRNVYESFKPHFCLNLHGQRTIFSAGNNNNIATVSFLAPAQDKACTITPNRMVAMEVIGVMNDMLQKVIPNQVGVYDDAFNLNCVGDTFQNKNVPTILFEAGHYKGDYNREKTRELIYISYLSALNYIAKHKVTGDKHKTYFSIPENGKCFYDVIIRNAKSKSKNVLEDIAFLYQEKLVGGVVQFVPKVEKIEKSEIMCSFYGHLEIDVSGNEVFGGDGTLLKVNHENVFVIINNEKILLLPK